MRALTSSLLSLALLASATPLSASTPVSQPGTASPVRLDDKAEYKQMRTDAGNDVAKLWKLVNWCESRSMTKERKSCLRLIVKQSPDDKKARELLGHVFHEDKWYTTKKKLDKALAKLAKKRAKEMEKVAKEKGLVRFGDEWVEPKDLPYLEKGLVKNEYNEWVDELALKRAAEGWVQQDLVWISPDDKANVDKGLWKCGDDWLNEKEADEYHSEMMQWWEIPTDYYTLRTTCARKDTKAIIRAIDETYRDLVRVFGVGPVGKPVVVVLNSIDQYNAIAGGDEMIGLQATDGRGWSSVNSAYFAEFWFNGDLEFQGAGVTFWDAADENVVRFANHWVRHAAAQSFIDGLDPSREAIGEIKDTNGRSGERFVESFWEEKQLPMWLRYGAATYAERYYIDVHSKGDKTWARTWSVANLLSKGGLDPVGTILSFRVDTGSQDGADAAPRLFNASGLLMAFVLDGKNADMKKAHGAFKDAFRKNREQNSDDSRKELKKAIGDFGDALRSSESDIKTFGGL